MWMAIFQSHPEKMLKNIYKTKDNNLFTIKCPLNVNFLLNLTKATINKLLGKKNVQKIK